jgi:tRNA U34 5-carboxymethylaminomethyl modifying GTPase MnmE/TrmE
MPESAVETLRATVEKLQHQVEQLEQRLAGSVGGSNTQDGMRMILIGPPGAGMSNALNSHALCVYAPIPYVHILTLAL